MKYKLKNLIKKINDPSQHELLIKEIQTIFREKEEKEKEKFGQLFAAAIYLVPLEIACKIINEAVQEDDVNEEMSKYAEIFDAIEFMSKK